MYSKSPKKPAFRILNYMYYGSNTYSVDERAQGGLKIFSYSRKIKIRVLNKKPKAHCIS